MDGTVHARPLRQNLINRDACHLDGVIDEIARTERNSRESLRWPLLDTSHPLQGGRSCWRNGDELDKM